jgi:hypothetical protein
MEREGELRTGDFFPGRSDMEDKFQVLVVKARDINKRFYVRRGVLLIIASTLLLSPNITPETEVKSRKFSSKCTKSS